jgi:hypothetical protein
MGVRACVRACNNIGGAHPDYFPMCLAGAPLNEYQ